MMQGQVSLIEYFVAIFVTVLVCEEEYDDADP